MPLSLFPGEIHAQNLIQNGDFERAPHTVDNLWDGVDNSGRLRVTGYSAPFVVDINGDRKKDIVCGDGDWVLGHWYGVRSGMLWYYLNSGTNEAPKFTTGKFMKKRFDGDVKPVVVDWTGDGAKDLVLGTASGWVWFLRRKSTMLRFGDVKFIEVQKKKLDIGQFSAPAVADWDGDGKKDLILGEGTYSANSVHIYLNDGSSSYPAFDKRGRRYLAYGKGRMHVTPSIVDWDKDGDLDLVVGNDWGYIDLYMNEAGDRRKIKILECAGRLKGKNGRDIRVGSRSTPCAVDWDEDGDWDIVCGNSAGFIYLILNEGSLKKPAFASPVVLKGTNLIKSKSSFGWSINRRYLDRMYLRRQWRREGAYSITVDEQEPHSGKYSLNVFCHQGYSGKAFVSGTIKSPLKRDVKYKFSFFVRGKKLKGSWEVKYPYHYIKAVVKGVRRHKVIEQEWKASGDFTVGASWKKVSGSFKLPKKPKIKEEAEAKQLHEDKKCYLDFIVTEDGTMWIDDLTLERAGR